MEELDNLIRNAQFLACRYLGRDVSDSDTESFYILKHIHTEFMYSMCITEVSLMLFYEFQHSLLTNHLRYNREDIFFFSHSETREHFDIS